jgi:tetrahydromethanopterin S-methyltransferase subunit G
MSEDRTQNLPNDELRQILAQLNSINSRLDKMDARLERLEARDYDTKPIWESAFKEIADSRAEMREGFEQVNARIDKVQGGVDELRSETVLNLRKVAKQIDVMNGNLLNINAELRFMDDRITKLEPQPTP